MVKKRRRRKKKKVDQIIRKKERPDVYIGRQQGIYYIYGCVYTYMADLQRKEETREREKSRY